MPSGLTLEDRCELGRRGLDEAVAERQLDLLRHPPAPARLVRAATLGDGITQLGEARHQDLLDRFAIAEASARLSKFVPASGAATRMFQALLAARTRGATEMSAEDLAACQRFVEERHSFAFHEELASEAEHRGLDPSEPGFEGSQLDTWLDALLATDGLGYAAHPKGLIAFHRAPDGPRTAFAEHLVEAAAHARASDGTCRLHFTVGSDHEHLFRKHLTAIGAGHEERLEVLYEIDFSQQSPSTDTLALDADGAPFRRPDGRLLLRPGGHGALLGNLAATGGDLVFVKNIDNVVPDNRRAIVVRWKKLLAGLLLELEGRVVALLERAESGEGERADWLTDAETFLADALGSVPPLPENPIARSRVLAERLDRPWRVCGMVRNTGEPGGGPFWVAGPEPGETTLQIVETSQIDRDDPQQAAILASSTHFNPVDLVCRLRDHHGRTYDLAHYVDRDAVFVSSKSQDGRPLRALEHPGLWNGAMARWNTIFVEVPAETFAPVKTLFDLLRPEHQP